MKAADYIALYLERRGVAQVFELVGGMITFLLDSLHQKTGIQIVSMHHEQGAAFAAEGAGRMTGMPGVAMATSGPGATNLLTAIGSCYFDSTPAVFITGQVNTHEQKGQLAVRQLGFQETDIVSMARPITKAAWLINNADELPARLEEAFQLAVQGRPGPVLLDIPMDIQRAVITDLSRLETDASPAPQLPPSKDSSAFWEQVLASLHQSQRPLILAGGGVRSGAATDLFRDLVHALGVPVVHSLMAVDVLPATDPLRVGMIGSYGNRWANIAVSECDFMLILGSRLDVRQTGADTESFKGQRTIYHIDCEAGEMNNRVKNCHAHVSELRPFLMAALEKTEPCLQYPWLEQINASKSAWPDTHELKDLRSINPNILMHVISAHSAQAAAYVVDVGQHQMWAAQSLQLGADQRFLTSGGMGAMGFALPTAIGASLAAGGKPVVVVAGDGGLQLNIQELQTIRRMNLPVKIIVLNNHCHGMVRQFQQSYFDERYHSTLWGYSAPAFHLVATAYGIPSRQVADPAMLDSALEECWQNADRPFLLEVMIDSGANAYPKMAFGRPISEMEPLAAPTAMEST